MESLKNILLFLYLLSTFIGIAGLTITILADTRKKTRRNKTLMLFSIGLVVMNIYDFFLYYTDYSIFGLSASFSIRLGCALIALLACLWANMIYVEADDAKHGLLKTTVMGYSLAYGVFWLLLAVLFSNVSFHALRWVLIATDILFILIIIVASSVFMTKVVLDGKQNSLHYLLLVTALILWNYVSFAWGETVSNLAGASAIRIPLDMTILFWFVVNSATIIFITKTSFADAYGQSQSKPEALKSMGGADRENVFDDLQGKYGLTDREKELCHLIYDGKSNSDISDILFITESTVKTHIYNLYKKTGVKSRMEILRLVREHVREEDN